MAAKTLEFSPFDQIIPRIYVRKLFCFPFPDPDRQPEAVERLEQSLSATIIRWPFITGRVGPAHTDTRDVRPNTIELQYDTPDVGALGRKVLVAKTLTTDEFSWTYQQLSDAGMPPSAMKKEILSAVPEHPQPEETCPAFSVQASFIEGGLILCFAFHHAVSDGASFRTFLKTFAAAVKDPLPEWFVFESAVDKRFGYTADVSHAPAFGNFSEYDAGNAPARAPSSRTNTTRILILQASAVQALEQAVKKHLKATAGAKAWVTTTDCLAGLVWVAVARARKARLDSSDVMKFGSAVDFRSRMDPPLRPDYFGNAIVHAIATATVSELIGENEVAGPPECKAAKNIDAIVLAASRIHDAIQAVDSINVKERLNILSAISDPTQVTRAYKQTLDTPNTGIDFSSWRDQGAEIEFSVPGAGTTTAEFWRKTWSANEGVCNILPRKGGSKGEADWEVLLALSVEDMESVCSEGELGAWVSRVVE